MAHRRLACIALPVGVGHEADRSAEGHPRLDGRHVGRVEWEDRLQPEQGVEEEHGDHGESQQRHGVAGPALLHGGVDAADPVEKPLDGEEEPVARRLAIAVDTGHVPAEDDCGQRREDDEDHDEDPTRDVHQNRSGSSRAITR